MASFIYQALFIYSDEEYLIQPPFVTSIKASYIGLVRFHLEDLLFLVSDLVRGIFIFSEMAKSFNFFIQLIKDWGR